MRWRKHEDRNLRNQDFKTCLAWRIRSGQMSGPKDLAGFSSCRALASSSVAKFRDSDLPSGVSTFHKSNVSS